MAVALTQQNGWKDASRDYFDPIMRIEKAIEARQGMRCEVAKTFLQLAKENLIPSWVIQAVDIENIRLASS